MACQEFGEGAFSAAITTHHGMNLAGTQGQIDPFEDGLIPHRGMEITDLKKNGGVGSNHGKQK
jgi:hypothetical protein